MSPQQTECDHRSGIQTILALFCHAFVLQGSHILAAQSIIFIHLQSAAQAWTYKIFFCTHAFTGKQFNRSDRVAPFRGIEGKIVLLTWFIVSGYIYYIEGQQWLPQDRA